MTTKAKTPTKTRIVTRAAVGNTARGVTFDGHPAAAGAYIPWQGKYERNPYLSKARVNEADLQPCERHPGLEFLNADLLQKHIEDDERQIETLRERIPALEAEADALDAQADGVSPHDYPYMVGAEMIAQKDAARLRKYAEDTRAEAQKWREKLATLGA